MALDPQLGSALTNLLAKRKPGMKGVNAPAGADMGTMSGLGGMPTANPNWKPPPGAMGNVAPPVGATAGQNQAASQAQNPARRPFASMADFGGKRPPAALPKPNQDSTYGQGMTNPWPRGTAMWETWKRGHPGAKQ